MRRYQLSQSIRFCRYQFDKRTVCTNASCSAKVFASIKHERMFGQRRWLHFRRKLVDPVNLLFDCCASVCRPLFSPCACSTGFITHWMQQLSRRLVTRAGLLNLACQSLTSVHALGNQGSAISVKSALDHKAQHTLTQCISTNCIRAPADRAESTSLRCLSDPELHWAEGRYNNANICAGV